MQSSERAFDAIIIGAGNNGLACATRLAQLGRKVLVLEAGQEPGGTAVSHEFAPGFHAPLAHILHQIDPRVEAGMDLARHGLRYLTTDLASTAVSTNGAHLRLDGAAGARITGPLSDADRASWTALRAQLLRFAGVLAPFKQLTPPRLAKGAGNENWKLLKLGLAARMLGKDDFRELLRMLLINVHDVLNDELSDPLLKGLLAFDATLGSWLGPRAPNSLILLLNRLSGQVQGQPAALALPAGGMAAVTRAMAAAATAEGVEIRLGARASRINTEYHEVIGVTLQDGLTLTAPVIISAINPKTTFLDLVGPRHLDSGFTTRIRHQKSRGAAAKLHLALRSAPDFRGADLKTRLVLAPSEHAVERAFNPVKYNDVPESPVMEVLVPSAFEAGHAPEGKHLLSAVVQFAPHDPRAGQDAARVRMLENSLAVLEAHAPGLRDQIEVAELLMPYDIDSRYGLVGGNWHHGELSVEQMLFVRPLPGLAQYSTPLPGLWLAGAGCHPGGGISGAAGWNAAEAIKAASK